MEHSKIQQESISPVFSLIVEELLKPLHIAETIYKSGEFTPFLEEETLDAQQLVAALKSYEDKFDLVFFAASEKKRKQYLSNGREIELIEGKVAWYFEALALEQDFMADLGDVNNVHLFFDFKVYDEQHKFLGIVGVGKSMQHFLRQFEQFKAEHGYDFIFVNEKNQIMLSSRTALMHQRENILQLESLSWYEQVSDKANNTLNSLLIEENQQSFLLSEVRLQSLNWRMILLLPLQGKMDRISQLFLSNFLAILMLIVLFILAVFTLSRYVSRKIAQQANIDHLSQLPNRRYVERRFERLKKRQMPLSLIVLDIDHFKSINDNYGHNIGDVVIQQVSDMLRDAVRTNDVAARWGGEEFILLLPGASFQIAQEIAERLRRKMEKTTLDVEGERLGITSSFGVTYSDGNKELLDLVAIADEALYQAKQAGRNKVQSKLP
ncbi:GGDEF domain-containing protein [Planctobacterium marinum]|uniref:diguanylate cyclase n=2 Tax=Planctobacterium marinum TaxID=1631968 RepID=A0AA48HPK9_9ALTE|nr:GGDEF domain-containing protein [Planctobacterium marinum]